MIADLFANVKGDQPLYVVVLRCLDEGECGFCCLVWKKKAGEVDYAYRVDFTSTKAHKWMEQSKAPDKPMFHTKWYIEQDGI